MGLFASSKKSYTIRPSGSEVRQPKSRPRTSASRDGSRMGHATPTSRVDTSDSWYDSDGPRGSTPSRRPVPTYVSHREPSYHPASSEVMPDSSYGSARYKGDPLPHRRQDAVPRQQTAYTTRTGTLGYGRTESSSLQREYDLSKGDHAALKTPTRGSENFESVQPISIFQDRHPAMKGVRGGICASMSSEWLRLYAKYSSHEASKRFGDMINNDIQKLIDKQKLMKELASQYNDNPDCLDSRTEDRLLAQIKKLKFGGLPMTNVGTEVMTNGSARMCALDIIGRMAKKDGLYYLSLENRDVNGTGHAMTVLFSSATREFYLMDPNSWGVPAPDPKDFAQKLTDVIQDMDYDKDYARVTLYHAPREEPAPGGQGRR